MSDKSSVKTNRLSAPAIIVTCISLAFLTFCLLFANPLMPTYAFTEAFWVAAPPEAADPTLSILRTGDQVLTDFQKQYNTQNAAAENSMASVFLEPQLPPKAASSTASTEKPAVKATKPKTYKLTKSELLALSDSQLLKINSDYLGKLYVEGAAITELVAVGQTNDKYLRADFYGDYAYYGTIFGDSRTSRKALDRNTILMGHNTGKSKPNDHAFGKLRYYRTAGYAVNHPYITLQTVHGNYKFQIFSVFLASGTVTKENYPDHFMRMEFKDDADFAKYLSARKAQSLYDTGVTVSGSDKVLTLVCCVYDFDNARLIIMAKQV